MAYIIFVIIKFWNIAWAISIVLMIFRSDSIVMFAEVFGRLVQPNIFSAIISAILIYIMLPFTIPYSIANIIKNN